MNTIFSRLMSSAPLMLLIFGLNLKSFSQEVIFKEKENTPVNGSLRSNQVFFSVWTTTGWYSEPRAESYSGYFKKGATVSILEENGSLVRVFSPQGDTGWISKAWIKPFDPKLNAIDSINRIKKKKWISALQAENPHVFMFSDKYYSDLRCTKVAGMLPRGTLVNILDADSSGFSWIYYQIQNDSISGFAKSVSIVSLEVAIGDKIPLIADTDSLRTLVIDRNKGFLEKARKEQLLRIQSETAKKQGAERTKKEWESMIRTKYAGSEFITTILGRKIRIGMTDKMVIDSWGKPIRINKDVGSWGVNEQWIYGNTYLYFENGELVSYQTNK